MYQNEILVDTCHCYLVWEDQQLNIVTVKVSCIDDSISGKITKIT